MPHRFNHYIVLLGSCALLGLSACGSEDPQLATPGGQTAEPAPAPSGASAEDTAGSIELALNVGSARLESLNYSIVGAGFATSGTLDVSHSSKVSTIIGGIPFGSNYALTMTGKGVSASPLDCSGSVSFDINSVGPVPVTIPIKCKEPEAVEPPPPTPAPVPPLAVFTLACLLAALGVAAQRRTARG